MGGPFAFFCIDGLRFLFCFPTARRVFGIGPALVGQPQKIIRAGVVEFRQGDENVGGDIPQAQFIAGIGHLTAAQNPGSENVLLESD